MSLPLIDLRAKVTPETEAVLEAIFPPLTLAAIRAKALAFQTSEVEIIREVVDDWAKARIALAGRINEALDDSTPDKESAVSVRRMPKRRREVFESSGGNCHYCGCSLDPSGKWHIDHKIPKALMGSDEKDNLVASCVPCNLKKRDRTDSEFLAMKGR